MEPLNRQARILIVEDNDEFLDILLVTVRLMGHKALGVDSVPRAQECLRSGMVDLVITDWLLPDGTGGEVCCAARAVRDDLPIIVVSGLYDERENDIRNCKPDVYLIKPFKLNVLKDAVQQLLDLGLARGATIRER